MTIEIKKSVKPIKYKYAIDMLEERLEQIRVNKNKELIWILEHEEIYTGGTSFKSCEILDKSINFVKTNRGGKITYHGPGQIVFYFVLDLNKRGKNIKKILTAIEKTIIDTLKEYKINGFADRKNIGIWFKDKSGKVNKIAAIGIKVKKWIAYHGFALNISNNLDVYKKIIPCGISNRGVTNLKTIKEQNYKKIKDTLIKNFLSNIKN
ncbi:lipoyl(octanoyl) transferase LipB [Candidatus Pelagibacter sp.]|nr:lipoyl(octanoyl) transferase LipB [Candidatus Pelagibacter sp.]